MTELTPKELYERIKAIEKNIDSGEYDKTSPVFAKRAAILLVGEYLPYYDSLKKEEKEKFPIDAKGLAEKVNSILQQTQKVTINRPNFETISKKDKGRRLTVSYRGQNREYWIPENGALASGNEIRLTKAYHIVEENKNTMGVFPVNNSESEAIKSALYEEVRKTLGE